MEDGEALAAITASNARILTIAPHVYRATEREIARVAPKVRGLDDWWWWCRLVHWLSDNQHNCQESGYFIL